MPVVLEVVVMVMVAMVKLVLVLVLLVLVLLLACRMLVCAQLLSVRMELPKTGDPMPESSLLKALSSMGLHCSKGHHLGFTNKLKHSLDLGFWDVSTPRQAELRASILKNRPSVGLDLTLRTLVPGRRCAKCKRSRAC